MLAKHSKKHLRRRGEEAHTKWVAVDASGLVVTVNPPKWTASRDFDFRFLSPLADLALAKLIALAFGHFAARFARRTAGDRYEQFKRCWVSVAGLENAPRKITNLRDGGEAIWWKSAARKYAVAEYARAKKQTTAKANVQSLFTVFDELASCGLVPDIQTVTPPKNVHLHKVPRPGLVEQARAKTLAPTPEERSALVEHLQSIGIPVEDAEAEQSIVDLLSLLEPEERRDPKKASQVYFDRTNSFLSALTDAAEAEFLKWQQHFRDGQVLLQSGDPGVVTAFDAREFHQTSKTVFDRFFPKNNIRAATANLLLLARDRFKGCIPTDAALEQPFSSRVAKFMSKTGGKHLLDAMLTLHRNGVAAAAILYMRDTGANVSTCLSLKRDFERPTSEAGVVEFFAVKARANYKAIYDCLPVNDPGRRISTVRVLRALVEMTTAVSRNFPELNDSLFVFRFFEKPSCANYRFLDQQLKYLLAAADLPLGWTLSGIRAAVAISQAFDGTGSLRGVARKLQHGKKSAATTAGYVLRWPVRATLELQMAKYQGLFEAGLASNLEGALAWLGRSPEEAEELLREAQRTGLGFLCLAPSAGARPGHRPGTPCQKTGECPQCHVHVFLADEESLAEVLATNLSLQANESRLRRESAERFDDFWSELMAYTTVAIASAKRGPLAYLVPRAERRAKRWIADGFDITDLRP